MDEDIEGLSRLCKVYFVLDKKEKEKIIRLAEGLLSSQKILKDEKENLKNNDKELNIEL